MRFARIAGIDFKVNIAFLLICLVYTLLGLGEEILLIVSAVLVHELAHTVAAVTLGVKVFEVELLPFGGQSKIEDFTGLDPEKEIYIALAGPLVSFLLAAVFSFLFPLRENAVGLFININLSLGGFNILPALPLDGGRVLRALLSKMLGYRRATMRAAALGKISAVLVGGYGIYLTYTTMTGANLIIIGVLLFWAAGREAKFLAYAFMRFLVNKKSELARHGFMQCQQLVARADTPVKTILDASRPSYYLTVLIVGDNDSIIAVLSEAELIECLLEKGPLSILRDC